MIGDAAYEALWYELNPIQNRDILFIIVRSQKYLTLTIGKIASNKSRVVFVAWNFMLIDVLIWPSDNL